MFKMENRNKYAFIIIAALFLILPRAAFSQTNPLGGDVLLKEYLFPISSYAEVGNPQTKKAVECEGYKVYDQTSYLACANLPDFSKTDPIKKFKDNSSILTTGIAKFSYKFDVKDQGDYDFKISASNDIDNFYALTRQQIDYILQTPVSGDSYQVDNNYNLSILEYSQKNAISGNQKYELFRSMIFSVYVDGEADTNQKGFIIIKNTDSSNIQDSSVAIGNLVPGSHTIYLHFLSDFYYNFSTQTSLPDYLNKFENANLDPLACVGGAKAGTQCKIDADCGTNGSCQKPKILDTNPIIYSVAIDGVKPTDDIVGVRIYSNNQHKDPLSWYQENLINPSPNVEQMTVDGYQAVRDDRTVYVNASNLISNSLCAGGSNDKQPCSVNAQCPDGGICQEYKTFFTNIYVIAYNQAAALPTVNIFNQMLNNWVFNKDILAGNTLTDAERIKDKLRRDIIRLSDLNYLERLISNYYARNKKYPDLPAGTFIKDHSISTWPSWQANLGKQLGSTLPVDPLNIMATETRGTFNCNDPTLKASCQNICSRDANGNASTGCPSDQQCVDDKYCSICEPGYDSETCWDQTKSVFDYGVHSNCPDNLKLNGSFNLGGTNCQTDGAYVYQYTALNKGQSYLLNYRLEYTEPTTCSPGWCYFNNVDNNPTNDCYQPGSCLYQTNQKDQYKNIYCYLGTWRNSCGDGFVQQECGETCDPNSPLPAGQTWCDQRYGTQAWYNKDKIKATCNASCQIEEFGKLGYIPQAYSTQPGEINCGGFCGDRIVQATAGEQCDEGVGAVLLKRPDQKGSGGVSQTSQYMCSGTGGGVLFHGGAANCSQFASWDTNYQYQSCGNLSDSGWVRKYNQTGVVSDGGFKLSITKLSITDNVPQGTYLLKFNFANFGDDLSKLTNEQIEYIISLKMSDTQTPHLYDNKIFDITSVCTTGDKVGALCNNDSDCGTGGTCSNGGLYIPEYGGVVPTDPKKYSLLRSLIFSVYLDGETDDKRVGFVIVPATNQDNPQEGGIAINISETGPHTVYLHFVGDHFYLPFGDLTLPDSLNNFENVNLGEPAAKVLDVNPIVFSIALTTPELAVGKCKTYGGWCGDSVVQLDNGEQCDIKSYVSPSPAQTVNIAKNPGFEGIFSPWEMAGAKIFLDSNNYFEGRSSLRVELGNSSEADLKQFNELFGNKGYKVSLRLKLINGNINNVNFQSGDQSADNWNDDETSMTKLTEQLVNGWDLYQIDNFTPSQNSYKFRMKFLADPNTPNTSFYLDDIRILPVDVNDRPQYKCGTDSLSGKICQYQGGYCGDGKIQPGFGESCDDRVGLSCTKNDDCNKGTCVSGVCQSVTCNDTCKSTFCGDGLVQRPNSNGIYEICDWAKDPACSYDCQHIKLGGECNHDSNSTNVCDPTTDANCRQCGTGLSCAIRNFGDTNLKCLGARGSYGCFNNNDCILGYYCDLSTVKCEPEISTYLGYHPEPITYLTLPSPPSPPDVAYGININTCPDFKTISVKEGQYLSDLCTGINWESADNISKNDWNYKQALNDACGGTTRLPNITELYSLVRQTNNTGTLFFSDKEDLKLCGLSCSYNGKEADLCSDCGDDNYLYWSSTCVAKDASGSCLKAQAVNFKYGSIETYDVNSSFKAHCLKNTKCGNSKLEEGETCEFYTGAGGNLIEQEITRQCREFGYDSGFLHCDPLTCNFKFDNCYLNSKPNQSCQEICKGRKALDCKSVGLNISKEADSYIINSDLTLTADIASNNYLMDIDSAGNCVTGGAGSVSCNYSFVDRKANCKDTLGGFAPFSSEYSYCNCQE